MDQRGNFGNWKNRPSRTILEGDKTSVLIEVKNHSKRTLEQRKGTRRQIKARFFCPR